VKFGMAQKRRDMTGRGRDGALNDAETVDGRVTYDAWGAGPVARQDWQIGQTGDQGGWRVGLPDLYSMLFTGPYFLKACSRSRSSASYS
jgi:hypothetical protein